MSKKSSIFQSWPLWGLYAVTLLWTWLAGKDMNWDQLNYHMYAADLLVRNRWGQDYFAASVQSYLNPVGYLPFYAMVRAEWNDLFIALVLATMHFLCIVAVWYLYPRLVPSHLAGHLMLRTLTCALAFMTPIGIMSWGSSPNDLIGASLVLWALVFLLHQRPASFRMLALCGLMLGAAAGLKLTNGTFAIAFLLPIIIFNQKHDGSFLIAKKMIFYVFGVVVGFSLLHGYWSWCLWREFKNPFFPFFNKIFESPDFLPVNLHDKRFLGDGGLWGLAKIPWDMLKHQAMVYTEVIAPDVRAIVLVFIIAVFAYSRASLKVLGDERRFSRSISIELVVVSSFALLAYLIWGMTSRIGRYAMPLWLLLGPLVIFLASFLWPGKEKKIGLFASILLMIQCFVTSSSGVIRWDGVNYSGRWFEVDLPAEIANAPATFFSTEEQTLSFISVYLHPESSMANIFGQYVQPAGEKIRPRLAKMMDKNKIYSISKSVDPVLHVDVRNSLNSRLRAYGLIMSQDDCVYGIFHMDRKEPSVSNSGAVYLHFCPLERLNGLEKENAFRYAFKYDEIFDLVERACPAHFDPPGSQTLVNGGVHIRSYFNSVSKLIIESGAVYESAYRALAPQFINTVVNIKNEVPIVCPPILKKRYIE
ncbi:hypothetical protein EII20_11605 [Comamonadaceae bacterium OH2545_COT-014]|nr:hypothetical protein EII20_11605 [Comamonadaceae bacterium OH2545_COT-014]